MYNRLNGYYHEHYANKDKDKVRKPKTVGAGGMMMSPAYSNPSMLGKPSMTIRRTDGKGGYSQDELNDRARKMGYDSYSAMADAALDGNLSYDTKTHVATKKDGTTYDYSDYSYTPTKSNVSKPKTTNNTSKKSTSNTPKSYQVTSNPAYDSIANAYGYNSYEDAVDSILDDARGQTRDTGSYQPADLNQDGRTTKAESNDYFNRTRSQLGMSQSDWDQYAKDVLDNKTNRFEYFDQPQFSEEQRQIALGEDYYPRVQQGYNEGETPYYDTNYNQDQGQLYNQWQQQNNQWSMDPNWMDQFYNQQQQQWAQQQNQWQQQQDAQQTQYSQLQQQLADMQNKYAQMMENMGYYQMLQNYQNQYGMRNPRAQQYSPFL